MIKTAAENPLSVKKPDVQGFSTVTETPGVGASREQLSMLFSRYRFAVPFSRGKDVLEAACGAGQGLGYLARTAKKVVGGDIDEYNLRTASDYYHGRPNIQVQRLDAQRMSFEDGSFDVILLYEALYYLDRPDDFLSECRRLLRPGGVLLICTVNKEWPDFNPSPYSTRYFSARELKRWLEKNGFGAELFGGFSFSVDTVRDRVVSFIKRTAVALHLIPKTMRGKQLLKRMFFGKLSPIPPEVQDGMSVYQEPKRLSSDLGVPPYKVIYAVARKS